MNNCYFYEFIKPKSKNHLFITFEDIYTLEKTNIISFDFREFFLILDNNSKKLLDDILFFSDESITLSTLILYMEKYNIKLPTTEESYITNQVNKQFTFDFNSHFVTMTKNSNESKLVCKRRKLINSESKFKPIQIKNNIPYVTNDDDYIISVKKLSFKNSEELIIPFLNWILTKNHKFNIKKCKICKSYFVSLNGNNIYCSNKREICRKNFNCKEFSKNFKFQRKYREFKVQDTTFINKINSASNSKNNNFNYIEYLNQYRDARDLKIEKALELNDVYLLENFPFKYEQKHPLPKN